MDIDNFEEEEIQALIISIELTDPTETPNNNHYSFFPKNVNEARTYFCEYSLDAPTDVLRYPRLCRYYDENGYLTKEGKETAREIRFLRPPIYYWYRKYYSAIEKSTAFANFNRDVFGLDIDQFGFSSMKQIDKVIDLLGINENTICLDIGCGNGKIAEYMFSITKSLFVGVDYIPEAIESAQRRVKDKPLVFKMRHIDDILSEDTAFDAVMSMDSIFYGRSYARIFSDIKRLLKDDGVLVFATSENIAMETALDKYFIYEKYDYTADCFRIMKLKNRIMNKYKDDFAEESNTFIWKQYMVESLDESVKEIPDGFTRYIYRATHA